MLRVMLRSLKAHKGRLILTSVAVLMGVSLVTGTYVFTDTISGIFDELTTESTSGVDVYVRGTSDYKSELTWTQSREPIPEEVIYSVRSVQGARWVFGSVMGMAGVLDRDGDLIRNGGSPTLGMSWSPPPLAPVDIGGGRPPTTSTEVALDKSTAERGGYEVGDMVPIAVNGPVTEYELVGIITYGEANNLAGATAAIFDLDEAQRAFDKEGFFDEIAVTGDPGLDEQVLRHRIADSIPSGYEAVFSETVKDEIDSVFGSMIGYINTILLVFALIALFVGAFIIFNTFSIIVAQRLREFALLRSLGASPRQVLWGVAGEALLVGVLASALGVAAGVGVAVGLKALMAAFGMELPAGGLELMPRTIVVGMTLGVGVTLVSAIFPAFRAARTPPIAMMQESSLSGKRPLTRRSIAGAAVIAAGVGSMLLGLYSSVPRPLMFVGLGALMMFLGVAALSPLATGPVTRFLGYLPAKLSRMSGHLARENTRKGARRTATTASALMVGVALISFVAILSSSIKASTKTGLSDALVADLVVQETDSMMAQGFSTHLAEQLAGLPEVATISSQRFGEWDYDGSARFLTAVDPETIGDLVDLDVIDGSVADLNTDGVLIGEDIAEGDDLQVGDPLPMLFSRGGKVEANIAGIFRNYSAVDDHFVVSLDMYERSFTDQFDTRVYVKAVDGVSPSELRTAISDAVGAFPGLSILDAEGLEDSAAREVDQMLGLITALLGLAIVIAVIGIANTLGLSILERTRELGLLRAVGMTRRQLRTMIRWEAVIIALFGATLGLVLGLFFGWAVVTAMAEQGIERVSVPLAQLVTYLLIGAVTGVLAATLPARRAAKLDILRAVTVE